MILSFTPREAVKPASGTIACEASIIIFPGVRYELLDQKVIAQCQIGKGSAVKPRGGRDKGAAKR